MGQLTLVPVTSFQRFLFSMVFPIAAYHKPNYSHQVHRDLIASGTNNLKAKT